MYYFATIYRNLLCPQRYLYRLVSSLLQRVFSHLSNSAALSVVSKLKPMLSQPRAGESVASIRRRRARSIPRGK